jgi:uncharacterized protein (DUF1778 family)
MSRQPRADTPSKSYSVRLSDNERKQIHKAASVNDQALPDFVREALLSAAEETLDEQFIKCPPVVRRDESCSGLGEVPLKDQKK